MRRRRIRSRRAPWLVPVACGIILSQNSRAETGVSEEQKVDLEESAASHGRPGTKDTKPEDKLPRFAINSPFDKPYQSPVPKEGKRLWAASRLWQKAPELVVGKWLGSEPECEGKFLLIEFWATWCRQCRLAVPKLNAFQQRFVDDLVVIGISDEDEATVRKLVDPRIDFPLAIDTKARMKTELAVKGIPHVIVVEPGGSVVWEGFPLLKDHELTEGVLAALIAARAPKTVPQEGEE